MRANTNRNSRTVGALCMFTGLFMTAFAFAGSAAGERQAATSSVACADGGWTDTVTVVNGLTDQGPATVSGTGTALDGQDLPAGGGQQTVTLRQSLGVASVTVSGRLTWTQTKYSAAFHTTASTPSHCGTTSAAKLQTSGQTSSARTSSGTQALGRLPQLAADPKVTLCHRTNSNKNPYVMITVAAAGAFNGHLGHTGPIWNPTLKAQGIKWGDIIPPFTYQGNTYSLNWPAGMDIFNNDCALLPTTVTQSVPGPTVTVTGPTTTVTETVPVTTTETVTTTAPGSTVTTTAPGTTVTNPGPTTTVIVPGPTITLTETATATLATTATVVVTETQTVTDRVTETQTQTQTQVQTVTVTQTVPGCEIPVAGSADHAPACPTATVTETVTLSPDTVTVTERPETETVTNCPPGAKIERGSLAFTGNTNGTMSMIGAALTAGGLVCLIMGRRRSTRRSH